MSCVVMEDVTCVVRLHALSPTVVCLGSQSGMEVIGKQAYLEICDLMPSAIN